MTLVSTRCMAFQGRRCDDLNKGACTTPRPHDSCQTVFCVSASVLYGRWQQETLVSRVCLDVFLPLHNVQTLPSGVSPRGRPTYPYYRYWLALQIATYKRQAIPLSFPRWIASALPVLHLPLLLVILLLGEMLVISPRRTDQPL